MIMAKKELSVKGLGLTLGIVWGAAVFLVGITSMLYGYGTDFVLLLDSIYVGYTATFGGSIVGAIWGFIDAGIGGVIIAWLYNKLA